MSSGTVDVSVELGGNEPTVTLQPGFVRRLVRRPLALACMAYLLVLIGTAIIAPIVLPHVAQQGIGDLLNVRRGPSRAHLLGTDNVGRDVLDRLLVGTRVTMLAAAEAVIVSTLIGVPLGLLAGYVGGSFDRFVQWLTAISMSIPSLIFILVIAAIFPHNLLAMMIAFGLLTAPGTARLVRSVTLPVREELYIAAARVSGLSRPYIVSRHVLPRVMGVVVVNSFLFAAGAVGLTAGLAFLGILNPLTPTWGGMIQDGINALQLQPWLIWPPGIAIGLTVLAFTLLGDSVRDATAESWSGSTSKPRHRARPQMGRRMLADPTAPDLDDSFTRSDTLLSVEHLTVTFPSEADSVSIVDGVNFTVQEGEVVGIVGESGCGKTMTAMAVLGLLPNGTEIESGRIYYRDRDLLALSPRELQRVRGKEIALISQEPTVSLTPTFRVGWQIAEAVQRHHRVSRRAARERAVDLLRQVQLPEPELVARRYPHELSGGMAQRVAIARALAGEPSLLIADEPTTALDVTVQAEILDLLRQIKAERNMAILLITHDWGVVADLCDRAVVMYAGEIVEYSPLMPLFLQPLHPYTEALLASNLHHASRADLLPTIPGAVPKPGAWPEGCHFHPRCSYATTACRATPIPLERLTPDRGTRCIHFDQLSRAAS